jgi:D-proline reductase (dithiol) PrdB
MVRMETLDEQERNLLMSLPCHTFETQPWVNGPPLKERRVAIVTTSGLHRRDDRSFQMDPNDFYRVIPGNVQANDLVMSHISAGFDRTGYQRDWNVVFPLDRLRELAEEGIIDSVADFHYSVNVVHQVDEFDFPMREIARLLKKDNVNAAVLTPV